MRWGTLGVTLGATLALLLYYALSMAQGLSFYDSAELAMVAAQGGLGHPIGQPLHTLLGWLVTRQLPGTWGLTLMLSALPAALTLPPLTRIALRLAPSGPVAARWRPWIPLIIGLTLLHALFWESATRVEVYALAACLGIWTIDRMLVALERGKGWLLAGILMGLTASTNPYAAIFITIAAGPALIWALIKRDLKLKGVLGAILGGLIGLLPYIYIPLVADRPDAFVWGAPVDVEALSFYLRGLDYGHNRPSDAGVVLEHAQLMFGWVVRAGLAAILGLGVLASLWLGGRSKLGRLMAPLILAFIWLTVSTNTRFDMRVADFAAYFVLPAALLSAYAAALLVELLSRAKIGRWLPVLLGLTLLLSALLSAPSVFSRSRHRDDLARTLAQGALTSAPEGAVIVLESDHWVFPSLYAQQINGLRPDVVLLPVGLSNSSWFWAWLSREHPELKPFPIAGPGGRQGRVRRFLAAQGRPMLFEGFGTAVRFGRPRCVGPWLIGGDGACPAGAETPAVLGEIAEAIGVGAPTSAAVLAHVGYHRAEALWRLGQPQEALRAIWLTTPPHLRPPLLPERVETPPWRGPPLRFPEAAPIGEPGQGLILGARILHAARRPEASAWITAASKAGLTAVEEARPPARSARPR